MERLTNALNKKIVVILPAISILAMGVTNTINLRLHEKPQNISVYEWSCARARELVNQKRNRLLRLLNLDQTEWQIIKRNLRPAIEQVSREERNRLIRIAPITEEIRRSIYNLLEHPHLQQTLGITRIVDENFKITAERQNGNHIEFMLSSRNLIPSAAGTSGNTIYLIPELIRSAEYTNESLEATLGHELAHIQHEHVIEITCIQSIYDRQVQHNQQRVNQFDFLAAFYELQRAHEVEADIAGLFNNWILLDAHITQFRHDRRRVASTPTQPPINQRIQYLTEIYQAIQNDTNGNPNRQPRPMAQPTQERNETVAPNIHRTIPNIRPPQNRNVRRANSNINQSRNRQTTNRNGNQNRNPRRRTQTRRTSTQNRNRQATNRSRTQNRNPRRRTQTRRTSTQNRNRTRPQARSRTQNRNPRRRTQTRRTATQNRNTQVANRSRNQNRNPRRRTQTRRTANNRYRKR